MPLSDAEMKWGTHSIASLRAELAAARAEAERHRGRVEVLDGRIAEYARDGLFKDDEIRRLTRELASLRAELAARPELTPCAYCGLQCVNEETELREPGGES